MNSAINQDCQVAMLDDIRVGEAQIVHRPLRKRILLALSRKLNSKTKRWLKRYYFWLRPDLAPPRYGAQAPEAVDVNVLPASMPLKAGDRVRVKSWPEIAATLDGYRKLKGCRFMPEMQPYCDTEQLVFRRLEHFFDECEYSIKHAKGLVLLDGVMCQGVAASGRCDRSCFFFWREEWLEKMPEH